MLLRDEETEFKPSHTPFDFSRYQKDFEVRRARMLKTRVPHGHGESALDIGCGPGYFSKLLTDRGWETTAVDTDPDNIQSAEKYAGEAHLGDAVEILPKLNEAQYALVLALEIIEHMPKTRGELLLKEIMRVLKPGGKLILCTPNKFSQEGLWGYYWGEKIRKKRWEAWDETHVHIYSSPEIIRLVKTAGFAVDAVTGYYYEGDLPFERRWKLPLSISTTFPLNRLGFNILLECRKK